MSQQFAPVITRLDALMARGCFARGDSLRIFHGRGGTYGDLNWLSVDFFQPVVLVTVFKKPPAAFAALLQQLSQRLNALQCESLLLQRRDLPKAPFEWVAGDPPEEVFAKRGNLQFILSFYQQNVGFFLDCEPARVWLEACCRDKKVLNLFSYTCAYSVVATAAGAASVVNMDLSSRALSVGRRNHVVNALTNTPVDYYAHNIFKSWGRLRRQGPYDIAIIDPPSFQKGSFIATKDYAKVIRKMDELLSEEGCFLACLNAPEVNIDAFRGWIESETEAFDWAQTLPVSEFFPDISPDSALKMLVYHRKH